MPETDQEAVKSILIEISNMDKIMAGKSRSDLEENLTLERAVSMTLGLIGEKANKISPEFIDKHPEIEWRKIIAMRNRIVHSYEDLDFDIIYDTVVRKLHELKEQLYGALDTPQKTLLHAQNPSSNLNPKKSSRKDNRKNLKP